MKENPLLRATDNRLFLFCDIDGTMTPYGGPQGSPEAYPAFRRLASRLEVVLAYVTGRSPAEARELIRKFDLPVPDYLASDVGSTIERRKDSDFELMQNWWDTIARDWNGVTTQQIQECLEGIPGLRLQEESYQNRCKVSYYTDFNVASNVLVNRVQATLLKLRIRSQVLWSSDDHRMVGDLDVMPLGAGKLGAVKWLLSQTGISSENAIYAGDASNDLSVLASGLRSVMPRNGHEQVRKDALALLEKKERGLSGRLYIAKGGFLGFDGHVLGGVLEGIFMHFPHTREWMLEA